MLNQAAAVSQDSTTVEGHSAPFIHLLKQMPQPALIKDGCGKYVFMNDLCGELLGVNPEKAKGRTDRKLFKENMAFILMLGDLDVIISGRTFNQNHSLKVGKHVRLIKISKFPIKISNGVNLVGCTISDLTDRID